MMQTSRLHFNHNTFYDQLETGIKTIQACQTAYGLEKVAAYHFSGTGVRFDFASKEGDKLLHVFVELLPHALMRKVDEIQLNGYVVNAYVERPRQNNGFTDQKNVSGKYNLQLRTKKDALAFLTFLKADKKVKDGIKKARVKSWEEFIDSSSIEDNDAFEISVKRGVASNVETEWQTKVGDLDINVKFDIAKCDPNHGYHGWYGFEFVFGLEFELWDVAQKAIEELSMDFTVFHGSIEG